MDDQEQIQELKQEMLELNKQIQNQQQLLQQMYNRLNALQKTGTSSSATPLVPQQNWSMENFIGLRLIHLIGIVVLVIGLSIGVKYAIDKELISEIARIGLAYLAGFILFILSFRLKKNYLLFSSILFSGAMASLYFTTYAAFVYYQMIPFAIAFLIMVLLTVFTAMKAIDYDRREIAILGLIGAYAIPFLISQNSDRADLFFLYILIINLGVIYLSIKKGWKNVGRAAQLITWLLFLGWSSMRINANYTGVGALYMILFFALFAAAVFANKLVHKQPLTTNDVNQQFLNNLAFYFSALFVLAPEMRDPSLPAITGVFTLFMAGQTFTYNRLFKKEIYLEKVHLIFSISLAVLFIAFQWKGVTVTFLWLLLAVILFATGVWSRNVMLRLAAIYLMGLTLLKLIVFDSIIFTTVQKVIAYISLGILLLVISFFYQKFKQKLFE